VVYVRAKQRLESITCTCLCCLLVCNARRLEQLGGKSPVIIDSDADIDLAARRVVCMFCDHVSAGLMQSDLNSVVTVVGVR